MKSFYDEMVDKTQRKIQQSFLQLLREKHFRKVSVQDITTTASVNRGTFYLHYQDKYDLLNQIEENLLRGLELHVKRLKPDFLLMEAEKGHISPLAVALFQYIQRNAEQFQVLLGENNDSGFHKQLKHFFFKHFGEQIRENKGVFGYLEIPDDYLSAFSISAFLGLVEQWLDNDLTESSAEMANMYVQIILFMKKL